MYLEAKETARLYKLLSDQLGYDTTEAMFKYIDNKTQRSVEATIKTLATKDDVAKVKYELGKEISEAKADSIKWMFIFWVGQVGATIGIVLFTLKSKSGTESYCRCATKVDVIALQKLLQDNKRDILRWMLFLTLPQ